jgi:hypothetical protein
VSWSLTIRFAWMALAPAAEGLTVGSMPDCPQEGSVLRCRMVLAVTLIALSGQALSAQARPTPGQNRPQPEPVCFEPARQFSRWNVARAYISVLRRAAKAESLTVRALRDSSRDARFTGTPAAHLSDVLYTLDLARDEYRCAGRVLNDFKSAPDSEVHSFVSETREVFDSYVAWIADFVSELKRQVGGQSRTLVEQAEVTSNLRRRRDALTTLLTLNATGLSFLLLEATPANTRRLSLTKAQRDSFVQDLTLIRADSTRDVSQAAHGLLHWLSEPWPTR